MADRTDAGIGAQAARPVGQSQPDRPLSLHQGAQRAVVDDRGADGRHPAGPLERRAVDQHAAASRRRHRVVGPVHLPERVDHLEEQHEGRDQQPLGGRRTVQFRHQRGEREPAALGPAHQPTQAIRGVRDVRVGEQEVAGLGLGGALHPLAHRPELAGPAAWQGTAGQDLQPVGRPAGLGGGAGGVGGAVAAVVVHQNDLEGAWIVLGEQAADRAGDDVGFVAGRDHRGDVRPGGRGRDLLGVGLVGQPEEAAAEQQPGPDRRRQDAKAGRDHVR